MTTYDNPSGHVTGTSGADLFRFDRPLVSWATVDAGAGVDQLIVDRSAEGGSSFQAEDSFNSGTFFGVIRYGPYDPHITYFEIEDVRFTGSAFDDFFSLKVGTASSGLAVDFDGGAGMDTLTLDFRTASTNLFRLENGTITSSLGIFANFEKFHITSWSGNDVIQTGDQNDSILAYGGSDDIRTGLGDDWVYTETGGDYVDLGVGDYDHFQGNYTGTVSALTINIGATITVSNGVTALNAETVSIGGGSGDDMFVFGRVGPGTLYGGSGSDTIVYAADPVSPLAFAVQGYSGRLDGSVGEMSFLEMERAVLTGGSFDDSFRVSGVFGADAVDFDGAGGVDLLTADFSLLAGATSFVVLPDGTVVNNRGEFASLEKFQLYGGAAADVFTTQGGTDFLGGGGGDDRLDSGAGGDTLAGNAGNDQLLGGADNDFLYGEADDDLLDGGTGADSMWGGTGNDVYVVDNAGDVVEENAGAGIDEVRTSLASASLAAYANIENLTGISASGQTLTGNSGNNVITGAGGNDLLRLHDGGDDTVLAGAGNDNIFFIGSLTGADVVSGGDGTDTLVLQGAYGSLALSANVTQIENISILAGSNTVFGGATGNRHDYVLTTHDANFAAGVQARINGSALLAGEDFTFDGSAETDALFVVYGGKGKDTLTGGLGNDIFFYAEDRFASGDTVNGGAGYDGMFLRGNYTINFGAPGYTGLFTNIENLTLTSATDERYARGGGTEFDYNLILSGAMVGAGQVLTVSGALLTASETMVFDAGAVTEGTVRLFGGSASDSLWGGALADLLYGGLGADRLAGNVGPDVFRYQNVAESNSGSMDQLLDFFVGTDKIDLSRIDANTFEAGDQAFSWIGSNAFTGSGAASAGELRAYESSGNWFVEGDIDGNGIADLVIQVDGPTPLAAWCFML